MASLGAAAYSKGDWFTQEKAALFARAWVPVCAEGQLRDRGQFASATVGGWPLVALRNDAGRIVGLRNTCKHQSMMVLEQAAGQCDALRCRYHGWTYDLDGRFKSAPPLVAPQDSAAEANHLTPLAVALWGGLVMLNLAPRSAPLAVAVLPAVGALVHASTADLACNWKTYVEHRLGATPNMQFQWPLVFVASIGAATYVEQITPRSFLRTRIVSYVFGDAAEVAKAQALAAAAKDDAEALQTLREAGDETAAAAAAEIAAFRDRVRAAVGIA